MENMLYVEDKPLTDDEYQGLMNLFEAYGTQEILEILYDKMEQYDEGLFDKTNDNMKMQTLYECYLLNEEGSDEYLDIEDVMDDTIYTLINPVEIVTKQREHVEYPRRQNNNYQNNNYQKNRRNNNNYNNERKKNNNDRKKNNNNKKKNYQNY